MDDDVKRDIAKRMMCYVNTFCSYWKNKPAAKYKCGVFADINKNFTCCDNTGMLQTDHTNSCVTKGFKRYKFKGFDWTEESLMIEIEKFYKLSLVKNKIEDLKKDFQ
ncbi:MAG: hypothetical protein IKP65_06835 [Alphaproteobacteria bacterium]|nr:hypothetical protein [Alphaproteobacteria bacterium]